MNRNRKFPLVSITTGVVVVLIAVLLVWRSFVTSGNRKRLDAIAARGEPIDATALNALYKAVPDSENAALLWLSSINLVNPSPVAASPWREIVVPSRGAATNAVQLREATELIAANADALAAFRQAAHLSKSRYPVDLSAGITANLRHLERIRGVAIVLRIEAFVAGENGQPARAAEAIDAMLAAGRSLSAEPTLISQFIHFGVDALAFQTLQLLISRHSVAESQLDALARRFAQADDPQSLVLGLYGERAFFVTFARDPRAAALAANPPGSIVEDRLTDTFAWPIFRATGYFQGDLRFGLDTFTTNISFAKLPDPQRFQSRTNFAVTREPPAGHILSALFLPAFEKGLMRDTLHRAQARIAQVALAIERFRLAHNGKTPDELAALVPAYLDKIPIDPYDGQPVRFRHTGKGYVVYCVGVDEKDDGGTEKAPNAPKGAPEDVTFIVEREQ